MGLSSKGGGIRRVRVVREGPKRSCGSNSVSCSLPLVLHVGARQGAIGSNGVGKGSACCFPTMSHRFGSEVRIKGRRRTEEVRSQGPLHFCFLL